MRTSARSGCSSPAAAILTYDREAQIAFLYSVDDPTTRTPGDLCARHLARFVLPRSWHLDDRREQTATPEPRPDAKRRENLRAVPSPEPRTTSRRKWAEVAPSLFDAPMSDAAATETAVDRAEGASDDAPEPVWMPRFGPDSELDDVLDAKTPLLRRAFGGS